VAEKKVHVKLLSHSKDPISVVTSAIRQCYSADGANEIAKKVEKEKPQMLISGGTAYPREIDHKRLAEIARKHGSYYLADIAHEAGLVAANVNASPFEFADVVTLTTHKTLRGPKGAIIFCKKEYADEIDRAVFPGLQGGPMNHSIAGIAVALEEAQSQKFAMYAHQIVKNAKVLATKLKQKKFKLLSDGTDKHLILIDLRTKKINGNFAARALDAAGITTNRNTIPAEPGSPFYPSGLRLGTPFLTTRGMKEKEMELIAAWIDEIINTVSPFTNLDFESFTVKIPTLPAIKRISKEITALCKKFPLPL